MAGCSRTLVLALLAASLLGGCVSGRLFEAGRVSESLLSYDRAHLHEGELVVGYTVEVSNADGASMGAAQRAAKIPVAALQADPPLAVDAFPLQRVRWEEACDGSEVPAHLELLPGDGAPAGFRLCDPESGSCMGPFHSAALYRDRTAWWVWPALPLAGIADALVLPFYLVTTAPFFLVGD